MSLTKLTNTINQLYLTRTSENQVLELCKSIEHLKDRFSTAIVILTCELSNINNKPNNINLKSDLVGHIRAAASAHLYHELRKNDLEPIVIVSGGIVEQNEYSLSHIMKTELIRKYNLPEESIVTEEHSKDTIQNARFSSLLLDTLGFDENQRNVHLVTSEFHLYRASLLFGKHFDGIIVPQSAEQLLFEFASQQKIGDLERLNHFLASYLANESTLGTERKEAILRMLTTLPFGEEFIQMIAHYLRSS